MIIHALPYPDSKKKFGPFIFCLAIFVLESCSREAIENPREETITADAFVIGFDQCATTEGRILAILDPADTVITYNFPDTLYFFPNELFENYQYDCLFSDGVLNDYPVHITYRKSTQEELSAFICLGNLYTSKLSPLVKNKQVIIVSVSK